MCIGGFFRSFLCSVLALFCLLSTPVLAADEGSRWQPLTDRQSRTELQAHEPRVRETPGQGCADNLATDLQNMRLGGQVVVPRGFRGPKGPKESRISPVSGEQQEVQPAQPCSLFPALNRLLAVTSASAGILEHGHQGQLQLLPEELKGGITKYGPLGRYYLTLQAFQEEIKNAKQSHLMEEEYYRGQISMLMDKIVGDMMTEGATKFRGPGMELMTLEELFKELVGDIFAVLDWEQDGEAVSACFSALAVDERLYDAVWTAYFSATVKDITDENISKEIACKRSRIVRLDLIKPRPHMISELRPFTKDLAQRKMVFLHTSVQ